MAKPKKFKRTKVDRHPKSFTPEQVEMLKQDVDNVAHVSETNIEFTERFKDLYVELRNCGKEPEEIYRIVKIDHKILGKTRVRTFEYSMRKRAEEKAMIARNELKSMINSSEKGNAVYTLEDLKEIDKTLIQLKTAKAYLEKENELLKKGRGS